MRTEGPSAAPSSPEALDTLLSGVLSPEQTASAAVAVAERARRAGDEPTARLAEVFALDVHVRAQGPVGALETASGHLAWALSEGHPRLACHCHALLAMIEVMTGHPGRGAEHAVQAVALLGADEDPRVVVRLLTRQAVGLFVAGLVDDGLAVSERAVAVAEDLDDPAVAADLAANAVQAAIDAGRTTDAERWTGLLLEAVERQPGLRCEMSDVIARGHLSVGRPELALRELSRPERPDTRSLAVEDQAVRLLLWAQACRGIGDLEGARASLARASTLVEAVGLSEVATALLEEEAALAAAAGEFQLAYEHHRRFHAETRARWAEASTARVAALFVEQGTAEALARAARAEEASTSDALTGVRNRRWVQEQLPRLVRSRLRSGGTVGLAVLDLDHFKRINDRLGHDAGDEVLRGVAAGLSRCAGVEHVARLGGEEFLLVLGPPASGWDRVTGAVLDRVRALRFDDLAPDLRVTASIGVGEVGPDVTFTDALRAADRRLYRAKTAGRDRAVGAWSYRAADGG